MNKVLDIMRYIPYRYILNFDMSGFRLSDRYTYEYRNYVIENR